MKKVAAIIVAITLVITLASCSINSQLDDYFGFSKKDFTVVAEQDTHGGFHGDGSYYLILDCSNNVDDALSIVANWNQLPLSEKLNLIMYGGEKDGVTYGYNLAEEARMPAMENGYYRFEDRHSGANEASNNSGLFGCGSFNFSLAVYDSDTNRLYYFEFDT